MKRALFTGAAMLMTVCSAAFAQTNPTPAPATPAPATPAPATAASAPVKTMANGANIREELTTNLQKSGFTDVKVMPDSFLIQAKDKTGNPVTMFLSPGSLTEVTDDSTGQNAKPRVGGGMFANVPATDDLSSKVVGLEVYNNANQDIGTIKDIAFNAAGVKAYIVGVGGFLGMGDHYVAVRPSAMALSYNSDNKTWRAMIDTNADQLKAAPEYKYSSNS
jgi:hypothetical protein